MGVVPADQESPLIELDVIRDRHGLAVPERQKASWTRSLTSSY